MAIQVADGFKVTTDKPIDERFKFPTITDRDNLSLLERYEGLTTYVAETGLKYFLKGGIANANWTEVGTQGAVVGPATSTDNALARFDGATGKVVQNSTTLLSDAGVMTGLTGLNSSGQVNLTGGLNLAGNAVNDQTGSEVTLTSVFGNSILITGAITSIAGYANNAVGRLTFITNATPNAITILNDSAAASSTASRIITGTGKDEQLPPGATILLQSSPGLAKHLVVRGLGVGGGSQDLETAVQLTADEPITEWTAALGGFSISKVDPIQGDASYVLELGAAMHAIHSGVPIDPVFRGKTLALTLDYEMPVGGVRVVLLDQTNAAIPGPSFDISAENKISKFGTTFFVPDSVTAIKFEVASTVNLPSDTFKFDNVQISSDLLKSVDIEDRWQQVRLEGTTVSTSTNLNSLTKVNNTGNSQLFNLSSSGVTALRDIEIEVTCSNVGGEDSSSIIYSGGVAVSQARSYLTGSNMYTSASYSARIPQGGNITFSTGGPTKITILAKARTNSIVAPTDQVSERSITFSWKSTALNANSKIGDYNTFIYPSGSNTKAICDGTTGKTRPDQTDLDMNTHGIRIFTRASNQTSIGAEPVRFEIKIAEPFQLSGSKVTLFKSSAKQVLGALSYFEDGAGKAGLAFHDFNPNTGILTIDGGLSFNLASALTVSRIFFDDGSFQNNGYVTFTASKLAQAVAIPKTNPVAIIKDVKPAGTEGGTATAGAWYDRTLNTLENPYGIVSDLSANKFTLPRGRYIIEGFGYFMGTRAAQNRIIGSLGTEILGSSTWTNQTADYASIPAPFSGIINLTSSEQFSLQYRVQDTKASYGLGGGGNGNTWSNHSFAEIKITKLD